MALYRIPTNIGTTIEAQEKWLHLVKEAQNLMSDDVDLQQKAAKGLRLKERKLPVEVLGRTYAQYCDLINKLYDAYLNSVHLQRAPYIQEIVRVFIKRLYELRNEMVHLIVNDYIYVDTSLVQLAMTPYDIQIVVPYHFPLEARFDTMEQLLQKMWADAVKRKNAPPKKIKEKPAPLPAPSGLFDGDLPAPPPPVEEEESSEEEEVISEKHSEHTIIPEEYIQAVIIQRMEKFRQFFRRDFAEKSIRRKTYFAANVPDAPLHIRTRAAALIQKIYRRYMELKREHLSDLKRDILLGILPDPYKEALNYDEENHKIYERRREIRRKVNANYMEFIERENTRLVVFKKENQIDDITDQIREWFREWYYGYGFFPEFPYPIEGGTMLVIRGEFPTIEEKKEEDEKILAATKGKTKDQLKQEKEQAKFDAEMKAELLREQKKKEAENLFKMRCNPFADPGYMPHTSELMSSLVEVLQKYRASWSIYDEFPPKVCPDTIYGYMREIATEDLMCQMHQECRVYVDELMRLDLKLLIKMHQQMYKRVGWKYPRMKPRPRPKTPPIPKPMNVDAHILKHVEHIFDLGIITKPKNKIQDIYGDFNFAAYEYNTKDPDATFPPPGYGDIRRRLVLSCVFGSGIEHGAKRNKSVMLLGPERNGKSFLVDCVAGEMNAIKIDISPDVFSARVEKPAKALVQVFNAARIFQPAVIFMKNVERVFYKKVPPQEKHLKAKLMKKALGHLIKLVPHEDKVIFIGTCTYPLLAKHHPMMALFHEVLLVPRTDYGSLSQFFREKFVRIRSMPRDYGVQPLAQMLQGYGFGLIIELYNNIVTPERIVRLNVTPLSPLEFLSPLIEAEIEPCTMEDYQEYIDFYMKYSPIKAVREEYEVINRYRAVAYKKLAKKKKEVES